MRALKSGWIVLLALALACAHATSQAAPVGLPMGTQMGTQMGAPLDADDARHLLARAGFTPTQAELRPYVGLSREEAVGRLLRATGAEAQTAPPPWVNEAFERPRVREMSAEERKDYQRLLATRGYELRGWWMSEMLVTPTPLTERMTLFWHNHFVSSLQKVRAPQMMYRQNLLLRRYALGNFGAMLHAVAKDPAMIVYLDSASNRKGAPNENFAREVMELFTLGEGHYTESDIKEAARAYTGWSVEAQTAEFKWRPNAHDEGVKTVLGKSGNFDGDAVIDILLAQPATAEFIVRKMWREFVSPDTELPANRAEIGRIAAQFRAARYDIKTALAGIFTSPLFYAPENRAVLIKSPVELVVGTVRQLGVGYADPLPFVMATANLGQNLLAPPNVRGWPGGETWINSTTLLGRKQFVERLLRVEVMRDPGGDASMRETGPASMEALPRAEMRQVKGAGRMGPAERERYARAAAGIQFDSHTYLAQFAQDDALKRALLPGAPANPLSGDLTRPQLLKALMLDPMYQLK